jgi:VCBS repeat-containing protein
VNDLLLNDSDPDGDPLSLDITPVVGPSQGTVTLNVDGTFTYVPNANFYGADAFTYQILDGSGGSAQATVMITVDPVNDAPVVGTDSFTVAEDNVLAITPANSVLANDSDIEGEPLTVTSSPVTSPNNGVLILNPDGTFTYTPNPNFSGTDSFAYEVADASGSVSQATVTITVDPVADSPIGVDDAVFAQADTPLIMGLSELTANDTDADGDILTLTSFSQPTQGSLVNNGDGTLVYVPNASFTGVDTFTYTLTDPSGRQSTALVVVNVSPNGSISPIDPVDPTDPLPEFEPTEPLAPVEGSEAANGVEDSAAASESMADGGSDELSVSEMPELEMFGTDDAPANFIDSLTLGNDSDGSGSRALTDKFFADSMEVLSDVFEFEELKEFGLHDVNLDQELLWQALDNIERQLNGMNNSDDVNSVFMLQIAKGSGVALTAGYVAWILRGGMLASMLLSSMPMWKGFDPLPLLAARKKKRKNKKEEEEARRKAEVEAEGKELEELFTHEQTSKQGR